MNRLVRAIPAATLASAADFVALTQDMKVAATWVGGSAVGIGFAAAEAGAMLDADDVVKRGLAVARRASDDDTPENYDIVSGAAGRIGALLRLHARFHEQWMLDAAVAAGGQLIASAEQSAYGWSWGAGRSKYLAHNLTGYSHGTAGVALALLDLSAVTSNAAFRQAAEEAIRYERSCFSPQLRNWPDFRRMPEQNENDPFAYGYAWCHGAPGIGMSRLQAYRLTKQEDIRQEAAVARGLPGQLKALQQPPQQTQ